MDKLFQNGLSQTFKEQKDMGRLLLMHGGDTPARLGKKRSCLEIFDNRKNMQRATKRTLHI